MEPVIIDKFKVEKFNTYKNTVEVLSLIDGRCIFSGRINKAIIYVLESRIYKCMNLQETIKFYQKFQKVEMTSIMLNGKEEVNTDMLTFILILHSALKTPFIEFVRSKSNRNQNHVLLRYLYCYILHHYFKHDYNYIAMFVGKSRTNIYNSISQIELDYSTNYGDFRNLTEPIWKYWEMKKQLPEKIKHFRDKYIAK